MHCTFTNYGINNEKIMIIYELSSFLLYELYRILMNSTKKNTYFVMLISVKEKHKQIITSVTI